MKLYFDTNIYRFISERNETRHVSDLLKRYRCRLTVSAGNLLETYAVKSFDSRAREMNTVVQLANIYDAYPESYLHALEVRREIRRLRRRWLVPAPARRKERAFLKNHEARWIEAKSGSLPSSAAFEVYNRDAEHGIARIRRAQKEVRASMQKFPSGFEVKDPFGNTIPVNLDDPEVYWKVEGLLAWHSAVELKNPASRDYADRLAHFLRPGSFRDPSYLFVLVARSCICSDATEQADRFGGLLSA